VPNPLGANAPAVEVGQTKSLDFTLPGYTANPRSIYSRLNTPIEKVAGIGEGIWGLLHVSCG
jgi:hypothetical protein